MLLRQIRPPDCRQSGRLRPWCFLRRQPIRRSGLPRPPFRPGPGWIPRHVPQSRRSVIRRRRWFDPPLRPRAPRSFLPPPRLAASRPRHGCSARPRSSSQRSPSSSQRSPSSSQRSPNGRAPRTQSGHRRRSARQGGGHRASQLESPTFHGSVGDAFRSLVFDFQSPSVLRLRLPHPDPTDAELLRTVCQVQSAEGEIRLTADGEIRAVARSSPESRS